MIDCKFENGNKANLRHVTVDTIVLNHDKTEILLTKRAEGIPDAGKWCLPGGYMERDETTKQTAERETFEETGYEITDIKFLAFNDNPKRVGGESQNVNFLYAAIAADQTGKPDDESSEIRWFKLDELPDKSEIAFDHDESIVLHGIDG